MDNVIVIYSEVMAMSRHPLLSSLGAILENPGEASLNQFRAEGWFMPLWMPGETQEFPNGQVAISFRAREVDGSDRPMLFTYVDEAQARRHYPDEQFMSYSLGVVAPLAHQQEVNLAVVDGDDFVAVTHEQLMMLRDLVQLEADPETRSNAADALFLNKLETFMRQAQDYCRRMPDIRSLHVAAIQAGAAPMRAGVLLQAIRSSTHEKALLALFEKQMLPGDALLFVGPGKLSGGNMTETIKQLEPTYLRQEAQGWWARLFSRRKQPQIAILQVDFESEEAAIPEAPAPG